MLYVARLLYEYYLLLLIYVFLRMLTSNNYAVHMLFDDEQTKKRECNSRSWFTNILINLI